MTTGRKNIKLGKNEESCSLHFEAEDSVITKNQTKEGNSNKQHESNGLIDVELQQEASDSIIKLVQAKHFKDKFGRLKQKERSLSKLSKASAFCFLDPFIDGKSIIRVGEWIRRSGLNEYMIQ